ncbi:MAG: hypothetical protein QM808_15650 [Steroidobacteraceae bacterium]
MRRVVIVLGMLGLALITGCVTALLTPDLALKIEKLAGTMQPPAALSGAFVIRDERKPDSSKYRKMPLGLAGGFSCYMGITQLGYESFAPDRIARLDNALANAFPNRTGTELVIRRYDLYVNRGQEEDSANMAAATGGGVLVEMLKPSPTESSSGDVNITRAPKCVHEKMTGGWFDKSDLTNNNQPITIELDVTVFGRSYLVNSAFSPETNAILPNLARLPPNHPQAQDAITATLQQAMSKAQARLIERISADQTK